MNNYSIPYLIGFLFAISVGSAIYLRNKESPINSSFFLLTLSAASWQFATFFVLLSETPEQALWWCRRCFLGSTFIPITTYHFIINFLKKYNQKKFVIIFYLINFLIFIPFSQTKYFVPSVKKFFWGYWFVAGPILTVYLIFFAVLATIIFYNLISSYKIETSPLVKTRLRYLLVAFVIAYFGAIDYVPDYNISIYPFGYLPLIIYIFILSYTIVRHQLMEIEVVIKKTVVFAGMFTFVFGVVVAVAMLVAQLLGGANNLLALIISALIITFTLRPIETWLINTTDKFLFQKKYEYKEIIKTFIDEVITELNLDEVINSTLKLLDQTLHPYTAGIFILNKAEDKYQLYNAYGLEDKNVAFFTSESKLVIFLRSTKDPAVIKQIDGIVGVNPEIASEMSNLKAVVVLPLMLHNDLIGFISLGKKKSDEEYTKDDLDVLQDLARTESIAVGNAQLLTEAAQNERRAAIGTMAASIHHEIGNPLNIMSTKIQLFKLARQKGLLQDKPIEEVLDEAEAALDECLKQSGRISEITRKLSNFAKPSKEFKPQLISIPEEIEETLAVVGHDLELEKIKIDKRFSSDLSKILADRQEVQQIFFNLIRNAAQAIEGTGTITISALNTSDNKVHIEIQDTGKGIPEDKVHRIFEPFFTTKGPNKGTGLGLSIVRQLVWRNKGEITFRSEVGAGTTFILEFPKGG